MQDDFSQCYVSRGVDFFKENILKSWSCADYHDPNAPAIFIGVYHPEDIERFINHKSYKILFLGGSDFENVKKIPSFNNTFCPVFSQSLNHQLSSRGVICKPWPVSVKDFNHIPTNTPLGDKIYVYSGNYQRDYLNDNSGLNKGLFKECIVPLIEHLGEDRFIFASHLSMQDLIEKVYTNAFIFIKPNELGGNSTMWELAHMGRKTIACNMYGAPNLYNAELKYAKPSFKSMLGFKKKNYSKYPTHNVTGYANIDTVLGYIEKEQGKIGTINHDVINATQSLFTEMPWKKLNFWL